MLSCGNVLRVPAGDTLYVRVAGETRGQSNRRDRSWWLSLCGLGLSFPSAWVRRTTRPARFPLAQTVLVGLRL